MLTLFCQSLDAQTEGYTNAATGRTWNNPSSSFLDTAILNQNQRSQLQSAAFNMMMMGNAARTMMKENYGEEKIKAGKATTRITLSPDGSYIEKWAAKAQTPQEQQETRAIGKLCLQTFNDILKAKGLTAYDVTDAQALGFVMSYLVYNGKDPGDARLKKLRQSLRQKFLKDAESQGTPEYEKQQDYENLVIRTMLGVRAYEISKRQNVTASERQSATRMAREYAGGVLKQFWSGSSVDSIELVETGNGFGDKGASLAASGQGTTSFRRVEQSSWAESNAICYEANGVTRISGDKSCFYEMRKRFDAETARLGGANNDVAYANAVAFKIVYPIYFNGVELNAKQFDWVLKEMRKDLSSSSTFQNQSDGERQNNYDYLAYSSVRIVDDYQRAKNSSSSSKNRGGLTGKMQGDFAVQSMESARNAAYLKLQSIFQPRELEDYQLRPDGFTKVR
ncbi:MAG: hypothetical protein H7Z37_02565 [Pyrinomonadaceae bacterium]|nr:hypothetical protein [Pyrinomonadaceae bacterium]